MDILAVHIMVDLLPIQMDMKLRGEVESNQQRGLIPNLNLIQDMVAETDMATINQEDPVHRVEKEVFTDREHQARVDQVVVAQMSITVQTDMVQANQEVHPTMNQVVHQTMHLGVTVLEHRMELKWAVAMVLVVTVLVNLELIQ